MKGNPLVNVRIDRLECAQSIMNDLMELTIETISDEGLQQLRLTEFLAKVELDVSLLDRLAQKT